MTGSATLRGLLGVGGVLQALRRVRFRTNTSTLQKIGILLCKIIAIAGYHWGKAAALRSPSESRQASEEPAHEVYG